jgi:hypothetical protein
MQNQLTVKPHDVSGSLQLGDNPLHHLLIGPLICGGDKQTAASSSQSSMLMIL